MLWAIWTFGRIKNSTTLTYDTGPFLCGTVVAWNWVTAEDFRFITHTGNIGHCEVCGNRTILGSLESKLVLKLYMLCYILCHILHSLDKKQMKIDQWFKVMLSNTFRVFLATSDWNGEVGAQLFANNLCILTVPFIITHRPKLTVRVDSPNISFPWISPPRQHNFFFTS